MQLLPASRHCCIILPFQQPCPRLSPSSNQNGKMHDPMHNQRLRVSISPCISASPNARRGERYGTGDASPSLADHLTSMASMPHCATLRCVRQLRGRGEDGEAKIHTPSPKRPQTCLGDQQQAATRKDAGSAEEPLHPPMARTLAVEVYLAVAVDRRGRKASGACTHARTRYLSLSRRSSYFTLFPVLARRLLLPRTVLKKYHREW
ncbi:hypothetical protein B0J12DRAFT_280666 [Macrophomina phaseolina]|uniref:Uncharacterized protein n=1 Tax=Macrophomina phaseolina TaxID=35725 RepID=A0ABQ8GQW9_9PEZI|nr:hypothetical protein B0J12DRAFT_280666 [Macrophomina phaseolina]